MTETTKQEKKATAVVLRDVRISYPNLFTPRAASENAEPKYSAQVLIPKGHPQLAELQAAMKAAVAEKFKNPPAGKDRAANGNPIRKMEEKQDPDTGEFPGGYEAGGFFLSTSNKYKPAVVNRAAKLVTDENFIYPGCVCHISLNAYAWSFNSKWGVSFSLDGVQFVQDGERLDGRRPGTDAFAPLEGETPPSGAAGASDQDDLFGGS